MAGINDVFIGPYYSIPLRPTGDMYRHFLANNLPGLLENISLQIQINMSHMHDGAPALFARPVRTILDETK